MEQLFQAIRAAAGPRTWSRGVELARAGAVLEERADADEIVLRVAARGGLVTPTVHLRPADAEWECDCRSADDACEHAAAAAIAVRLARQEGRALPRAAAASVHVGYRFARTPQGLEFWRAAVGEAGEERLRGSLAAIASGAIDGPRVTAGEADLRIEALLDTRVSGVFPREFAPRLLAALAGCEDVRLDGAPVGVSTEPVLPRAVLDDRGQGFVLALARDERMRERFANGVALVDGVLAPLGEARLSLREREELSRGRYFAPEDVAFLTGEVLPALEQRLPVDIKSERLPRAESCPPRLVVQTERDGDELVVRAEIVYGDPPRARVEEGRLVHVSGAVPLRDRRAEERLEARLRRELGLAPAAALRLPPDAAIDFAARLARTDLAAGGGAHAGFFRTAELEPELRTDPGSFGLGFRTRGEGRAVGADAVLAAWERGLPLVPLAGGGFAPLPRDWLERFAPLVADLLAARDAAGRLPACALPDLARLRAELGEPPPPGFERLRALVESFESLPAAELPADLHAELRDYQRRGVDWLCFLREAGLGALLADDMGLGKTLEALCALDGRTLVVAPTSVIFGWAEQARRFRPGLPLCVYHGPKRALDPDARLVLTSYAILRLDADALARERWDAVVLDEAQAIKNPDSQVARAAFALAADFRVTLTGTPIENRLEELWSQMHFANPGLLGSREQFRRRHARPIADGEPGAAARLRERIRPFLLRRRKSEVAPELPPRTEAVLHCELSDAERAVYDAVRAAARADVVERLRAGGNVLEALEALLRLRQAACHSALVPGHDAETSSKLEVLLESLEEAVAEGHRALVFSQWTSLLDRVEPVLNAAGIAFSRLDGSTRDRAGVVDGFQRPDGPPVLLISLRAGGTGLNLTAADTVFLLDPWWNPAVEDQAADRAHRIGQDRPVLVYRLVARDTVEERILDLQARKRELADAALAGADRATAITREELLALLD